jgi:hypothetical protein
MDRRTGPRLVLALGLVVGLIPLARAVLAEPWRFGYNYRVYHGTARAVLDGAPIYGVGYSSVDSFHYLYPPATLLVFLALSAFGELGGYLLHTAGTVAVGLALAWLVVRTVENGLPGDDDPRTVDLAPVDRALVAGYVLLSVHATPSLLYGQVNVHVAAALGAGVVWVAADRQRAGGVAFALAAFPKAFPAAVGVWLLRVRAWRAVAVAVATGLAGLALGVLAFGVDATRAYVDEALLGQSRSAAFAGGVDPGAAFTTLMRPISVLAPDLDPALMSLLAAALLAPVLAVAYRDLGSTRDRLLGVYVTVLAVLLVLPSYPIYYVYAFFPTVALCYLLAGRARVLFLLGVAVTNVPVDLAQVRTYGPDLLGGASGLVLAALEGPLTLASVHLYGLALTLVACLVAKQEGQ